VPVANRYIVPEEFSGFRLDRALRMMIDGINKKDVALLIGHKRVKVNKRVVTFDSWEVYTGFVIEISGVVATAKTAHVFDPASILHDDGLLIVVDKPSGLRPEPRGQVDRDNIVTLLSAHIEAPVAAVHRIDRDTSGVMLLIRKSAPRSLRSELDAAFKDRAVSKHYLAVVARPNKLKAGRIVDLLAPDREHRDKMTVVERGGERAETVLELGEFNAKRQQLHLNPVTGRTHQLRIQLAFRGSPILGDRLYGSKQVTMAASRLLLHAHRFELPPVGGHEARTFEAPIPRELTIIAQTEAEVAAEVKPKEKPVLQTKRNPTGAKNLAPKEIPRRGKPKRA
jgi:RluA family pseudouridine synthase